MRPSDVATRLQVLPALDLKAVALLAQLEGIDQDQLDEHLVRIQPESEKALEELNTHVERTEEIIRRCLRLQPIPTHTPPLGF